MIDKLLLMFRKFKSLFFYALLCLIMSSCSSVDKKQVKQTVDSFFSAYSEEDINTALKIYPNIINLEGQFRKSTSMDIDPNDILVINDSTIIVKATHHWINPFGADNVTKMKFYMSKVGERYEIKDSKNFCMFDELELYDFSCKTGAINVRQDTTDVAISVAMSKAKSMLDLAKTHVRYEIAKGLTINKNWRWESSYYGDYADGHAVVTNNTPYPIDSPKYEITYYLSDDKSIVATDDGYICYDEILPGQSRSFSWFTSYVGNASRAKIKVVFNNENWIDEIVKLLPYTGREFDQYMRGEDWWPLN